MQFAALGNLHVSQSGLGQKMRQVRFEKMRVDHPLGLGGFPVAQGLSLQSAFEHKRRELVETVVGAVIAFAGIKQHFVFEMPEVMADFVGVHRRHLGQDLLFAYAPFFGGVDEKQQTAQRIREALDHFADSFTALQPGKSGLADLRRLHEPGLRIFAPENLEYVGFGRGLEIFR